ncbi:DGQHR domain-containing protein [Fibrobacterota bacterium]
MKKISAFYAFPGVFGQCGSRKVFLGFAPSDLLYSISFSDILNEDTGEGYQRPYTRSQSLDFKKYISSPGASTIPLVFNLRKNQKSNWEVKESTGNRATLYLRKGKKPLAQVDCQHRIGEMNDSDVSFAFMTFIGLDLRSEMAIFNTINSKARGLSTSLTDYHESKLIEDIENEAPHLFISRRLNEDRNSPWYKMIRYGGETTSGVKRRTSLRMMQKCVHKFLKKIEPVFQGTINEKYQLLVDYWNAVKNVFNNEWNDHRHHLICKGLGLYSLMPLLGDIVANSKPTDLCKDYFEEVLTPLKEKVDWHTHGMFGDVGGHKGVMEVYEKLKEMVRV